MHLSTLCPCLLAALLAFLSPAANAAETELPAGTRVLADIAYGSDARQRFDVYLPAEARNAPVLFIVHGGAWRNGWKDHRGLIANKAAHWIPKGYAISRPTIACSPKRARRSRRRMSLAPSRRHRHWHRAGAAIRLVSS